MLLRLAPHPFLCFRRSVDPKILAGNVHNTFEHINLTQIHASEARTLLIFFLLKILFKNKQMYHILTSEIRNRNGFQPDNCFAASRPPAPSCRPNTKRATFSLAMKFCSNYCATWLVSTSDPACGCPLYSPENRVLLPQPPIRDPSVSRLHFPFSPPQSSARG